jgi:hypothetical protein
MLQNRKLAARIGALHMDVEPHIAERRVVEIQAAVAEAQRRPGRLVERADHLPIGMRADVETAEIAIGVSPKPWPKS